MARTLWIDSTSGAHLDDRQMGELRSRARALYAVNTHIFEDELDALTALGAVSLVSVTVGPTEHRSSERIKSAPTRRRLESTEAPQPVQIAHHDRAATGDDEPAAA